MKEKKEYEEYIPIKDYLFRWDRGAFGLLQIGWNVVGGIEFLWFSINIKRPI